ncbi:MAG: 4-hydroxythreonine-4-phosphate dehydrogenase PdxA [Alphaproteobacteria bacterium]
MPKIALTIGDPQGIGPEITVKALHRLDAFPDLHLTIIGNLDALTRAASALGVALPQNDRLTYSDIAGDKPGAIAYQAIDTAVRLIADGKAQALVTGPISKKHLHEAGHAFPGHTEILETLARQYFNAPDARAEMLFAYKKFRLMLLTRHIALQDVPAALSKPGAIAKPLKTLIRFLRHQAKIDEPRIALLGLNPHAGEISGDEEKKLFAPVIHAVNAIGASKLEGCFAADAFFRNFDPATTPYDAIVAAYHDQGLIPFKLLAGYEAVNITIGLPFIRTSVSHGTAEDIAGQNVAREDSLLAALQAAVELVG